MPHFRDVLQYVVDMNMTNVHVGKMEVTKNPPSSLTMVYCRCG